MNVETGKRVLSEMPFAEGWCLEEKRKREEGVFSGGEKKKE